MWELLTGEEPYADMRSEEIIGMLVRYCRKLVAADMNMKLLMDHHKFSIPIRYNNIVISGTHVLGCYVDHSKYEKARKGKKKRTQSP